MGLFNSILIVCAGNICRSPMAEYLLKQAVLDKGISVSSAGLTALKGEGADKVAQETAARHGLDLSTHISRQINGQMLAENDLILVMEQRQLEDLAARYPHVRGKIFLLGRWLDNAEIFDPYRKSPEAFDRTYDGIERACQAWIKYL